ncbi:hypothetical protein CR513_42272, partial [Mucuna pruriens]
MEDHESIDQMFERFQTIIYNLSGDHRYVIALKASKDLKKLPMKELFGTLKAKEGEVYSPQGSKDRKLSLSKAFKVEESCDEALEEDFDGRTLIYLPQKKKMKKQIST